MDINYLFLRQQMERSLANAARSAAARAAHEEMARQYELEIERASRGQIVFPWRRVNGGGQLAATGQNSFPIEKH